MENDLNTPRTSRLILAGVIPFVWVLLMWIVHLLDNELGLGLRIFGVIPREIEGVWGIFASPLLHAKDSFDHIINNSIPALVLGWCLFFFYKEVALKVLALSWLLTGLLVWLFGRESVHIGASGVVYALASFLFVSGFIRQHKSLMAISFIVTFLYGSMIWGVLPVKTGVSWESHLFGGIVGLGLAWLYRAIGIQKPVKEWPAEDDEDDDPNAPWKLPQDRPVQAPRVTIIYHEKGKGPEPLSPKNTDLG